MVSAKLYAVAALGLATILAALTAGLLWYRGQAIGAAADAATARASLATAVSANEAQKAAIERLTANRALDDKLAADLQSKLGELAREQGQATIAIRDLEKSNADVKAFLAGALPAELKRLLNPAADSERPGSRQ